MSDLRTRRHDHHGDDGHPSAATSTLATSLVAGTGAQPDEVTIDEVPAGWTVRDPGEDQLLLAPLGSTDTGPDSFADIIVGLQEEAARCSRPT